MRCHSTSRLAPWNKARPLIRTEYLDFILAYETPKDSCADRLSEGHDLNMWTARYTGEKKQDEECIKYIARAGKAR